MEWRWTSGGENFRVRGRLAPPRRSWERMGVGEGSSPVAQAAPPTPGSAPARGGVGGGGGEGGGLLPGGEKGVAPPLLLGGGGHPREARPLGHLAEHRAAVLVHLADAARAVAARAGEDDGHRARARLGGEGAEEVV